MARYLQALSPDGLVSVPVSASASSRSMPCACWPPRGRHCSRAGVSDPAAHVVVYRSAWNVRILLSPPALDRRAHRRRAALCDARSFDVSYYPGMDVAAARAGHLQRPARRRFDERPGHLRRRAQDAIADEAGAVLRGEATPSADAFNLPPSRWTARLYYDVLLLTHLGTMLRRLEILPQAEIGQLVNLAVLAQAAVIALLVLLVPLLARRAAGRAAGRADRCGR